jgi:hypothetical protein
MGEPPVSEHLTSLELTRLILASLDGTITPREFAQLDRAICQDPEIADRYAEFMLLYTGLRQPGTGSACFSALRADSISDSNFDMQLWRELNAYEKIAEAIDDPSDNERPLEESMLLPVPRIERRISKPALYTSILSAAALILLLLYVQLNPLISAPIVGVVTETVDAKWHHSSISAQPGQDLRAGRMELQWGLARVRFDSGADVVIEGPAQWELLTSNSMKLLEGKVCARVGKEAQGFTVFTPCGKVLDIGTEFGVHVKPNGQADVQVFQGEVHLYPDNASHFVRMFSGDAKSVVAGGQLQDTVFRPMDYVRHNEMDARVQSAHNSYARWQAAVLNLHRDPSLAAHYFYAKDEANTELLINAAPMAGRSTDGRFGDQQRRGPQWVSGRWPQKPAVHFERDKEQVIIVRPDRSLSLNGPVTILTWVCFPDPKKWGGHLISCRDGVHINYQFSIFDDQYFYDGQKHRFEFLRYNEKWERGAYSEPVRLQVGRWYHMAVTYDSKHASFYLDGTLHQRVAYETSIRSQDTEIVLGAMKFDGQYILKEGDFEGIVDELMVFGRCFSETEIRAVYQAGVPDEAIETNTKQAP